MALLPNVGQIAEKRKTYVYAFFRLCRLHNVNAGRAEDFFALPSVLNSDQHFRSGVFRLAASILSSEPKTSVDEIVTMVALGVGGPEIASRRELEVPDELIAMFRSGLGPHPNPDLEPTTEAVEPAAGATVPSVPTAPMSAAEAPFEALTAEPAPAPAIPVPFTNRQVPPGPRPLPRSVSPQTAPAPQRRPPILQQALLADPAEEPAPMPRPTVVPPPEVFAKVEQLESENLALKRRVQEIETRLIHVVDELGSRAPAGSSESQGRGRVLQPFDTSSAGRAADASPAAAADPPDADAGHGLMGRGSLRPVVLGLLLMAAAAILVLGLLFRGSREKEPTASVSTLTSTANPTSASVSTNGSESGKVSDLNTRSVPAIVPRSSTPKAEIASTLAKWADASSNNNPVAESSFYAPRVARYFLERNVSRQFVLHDKQAYRNAGNTIQSFTIRDLNIELQSPSSAVVSLTKSWSVRGPRQTGQPHSSRSRLWLMRTPEGWKITGEQDFRAATPR